MDLTIVHTQKAFVDLILLVKIPSDTLMLSESRLESLLRQYLVFSTGETLNLSLLVSVGRISRHWTGGLAEFFSRRRLSKIYGD